MTVAQAVAYTKDFARSFVYAMGNRDNNLKALRELAIFMAVAAYLLGVFALAGLVD